MKRIGGSLLILNLLLSIVAFNFIFNIEIVSATKWVKVNGVPIELKNPGLIEAYKNQKQFDSLEAAQKSIINDLQSKSPNSANLPVKGGSSTASGFLGMKPLEEGQTAELGAWTTGSGWDSIISGAQWAAIVAGAAFTIGGFIGLEEGQTNALALALGAGAFTGKGIHVLFGEGGAWSGTSFGKWVGGGKFPGGAGGFSFASGLIVSAAIFLALYKSESIETKTFTCEQWQAPTGGDNCEKCNKQGDLPCSEYQCRSLGQSCELLNPGTNEEACTWVNRKDVNPPVIKPLNDALLHGYVYAPDTAISPPDKGVKVQNNNLASKCAEAFTPLTFGIITNEPAQCKISPLREKSYEDMDFYFGGTTSYTYNHTQVMVLPGEDALNASGIVIDTDGNFEVYTRCQDANGNSNTANFVFKYCVEKGPDTTPPLIVTTSLLNNMPIAYNQKEILIDVYTNEPATCKWDQLDTDYESMNNLMTCSQNILEVNTQMLYKCEATLNGLKNEATNDFYFRCKDLEDNTNAESYKFTMIGTRPLVIDLALPNDTLVSEATDVIQVTLRAETLAGYKDGEAACYYSDTGEEDDYVMFFNTNSYNHSQELWLSAGDYDYYIKCIDLGGNTDKEVISFRVESDVLSPLVVRVYREGGYLKLITNEDAECVYDTTSCSYTFEDGIKMSTINDINHFTDWDTKTNFYIKCKDIYGNKPNPDKCNIIAKPTEFD